MPKSRPCLRNREIGEFVMEMPSKKPKDLALDQGVNHNSKLMFESNNREDDSVLPKVVFLSDVGR